jgi:hypothetical protein
MGGRGWSQHPVIWIQFLGFENGFRLNPVNPGFSRVEICRENLGK